MTQPVERGADLDAWLAALRDVVARHGDTDGVPCPRCGAEALRLVHVAFPGSTDAVMPAFWCDACLRGLPPMRAVLPAWATATPPSAAAVPGYRVVVTTRRAGAGGGD